MRVNVESSGNLLSGVSKAFGFKVNSQGQRTLFNIAYAQYAKFDVDYTHLMQFDKRNALALHAGIGVLILTATVRCYLSKSVISQVVPTR